MCCTTIVIAIKRNHLRCVRRLYQTLQEFDTITTEIGLYLAAAKNNKSMLKALIELGINKLNPNLIRASVWKDDPRCLRYLHHIGCPWDHTGPIAACMFGALKCLRYLHEHNCSWNEDCYMNTLMYNHRECLQYLLDHECPIDKRMLTIRYNLIRLTHVDKTIIRTLIEHGCEYNKLTILLLNLNDLPWFEKIQYIRYGIINIHNLHIHQKVKRIQRTWLRYILHPDATLGKKHIQSMDSYKNLHI